MSLQLKNLFQNITPDLIFVGGFFIFLSIGLFLGDGKQPLIDTLASVVIISMYIFATYYLKKQRDLPSKLIFFWGINILFLFTQTFFSDSVGNSISSVMRSVMAYLLFVLFYEYATKQYEKYFIRGIVSFSLIAIAASLYFITIPSATLVLPLMNLVYANFGHNHISNILIFIYPITLMFFLSRKHDSKKQVLFTWGYFFLVVVTVFFSFSRGALFLLGLYSICQISLSNYKKMQKRKILIFFVGILATFSLILFSFLSINQISTNTQPSSWIQRQINKPLIANDGRIKYWRQSFLAIMDRPILGSGPGTFYLQSIRFQKNPNEFSWFAHSFPLEYVSEIGLIGGTIVILIILFSFLLIVKELFINNSFDTENKSIGVSLFTSVLLTLGYSFIEFNMSFLIIWLIFWTSIAVLIAKNPPSFSRKNTPLYHIYSFTKILLLVVLFIYYVTSILSYLLPKDNPLVFYISPYNKSNVLSIIDRHHKDKLPLYEFSEKMLLFFHKKDPEVLFKLALLNKDLLVQNKTLDFFTKSIIANPLNKEFHTHYIKYILSLQNQELKNIKISEAMQRLNEIFIQTGKQTEIDTLNIKPPKYEELYTEANLIHDTASPGVDYFISFYYKFGLTVNTSDKEFVKNTWNIMYNLKPNWSNFYIDFASYMKYVYHDDILAKRILQTCQENKVTTFHCSEYTYQTLPMNSVLRTDVIFN